MSDRYIRRFALPERLYTASAPVVLAAGVLLEDTRLPRLVAQLKWKSIDARLLTALTVAVRCPAEAGGDGVETVFTYSGLHTPRGQTFGVYTAVVLPGARSGPWRSGPCPPSFPTAEAPSSAVFSAFYRRSPLMSFPSVVVLTM